jgi:hypothetical protein
MDLNKQLFLFPNSIGDIINTSDKYVVRGGYGV